MKILIAIVVLIALDRFARWCELAKDGKLEDYLKKGGK